MSSESADTDDPSRQGGTTAPGTDADTGTGADTSSPAAIVTTVVSSAYAARASTSSLRAITRRSNSISAASSAAAARAASSRMSSTRSRDGVSRASNNPSIDAAAHPSTIKRKQDVGTIPHPNWNHA
ncbi:hypothetical protein [Streptomyces sp. NPDC058612]|uniref:hypothetical protein n=2 Tax=unclassified Streptomyces TaxID=2593676 RepID=UPI003668141D